MTSPSIAVVLLTCGRYAYTRTTLESFTRCNPDRSRFVLLHGDDASEDSELSALVQAHGFRTVVQHDERLGNAALRSALIRHATKCAEWTLVLENDIQSLRPFPWPLFDFVQQCPDVSCLRLYGAYKDQAKRQPCLTTHKREGHTPVLWGPCKHAPEPAQIGRIHWSAQPSVTRSQALWTLHRRGTEPPGLTVRVKQNVMAHIGVERTAPMAVFSEATC